MFPTFTFKGCIVYMVSGLSTLPDFLQDHPLKLSEICQAVVTWGRLNATCFDFRKSHAPGALKGCESPNIAKNDLLGQ